MKKKIIYIDMDDVLCSFSKHREAALKKNPAIQYPQSQYGFFRNLEPLEGAVESVNILRQQALFDVYILTAPSVLNPLCYTEKRLWIEDHFDMELVQKLIISPNKSLNKGDYLIDDNNKGKGQENFEGTLIHFGTEKWQTWTRVMEYFNQQYQLSIK